MSSGEIRLAVLMFLAERLGLNPTCLLLPPGGPRMRTNGKDCWLFSTNTTMVIISSKFAVLPDHCVRVFKPQWNILISMWQLLGKCETINFKFLYHNSRSIINWIIQPLKIGFLIIWVYPYLAYESFKIFSYFIYKNNTTKLSPMYNPNESLFIYILLN